MDSPILMGIPLAAASGLNAYLPLLIVAIADRATSQFTLERPYDFISSTLGILVLLALLTVELVADKIPKVDHVNDLVQSAIRPATGAILFMAVTNADDSLHPLIAMVLGLLIAGAVHWVKTIARPQITLNTGGFGNPIVSTIEDALCAVTAIAAVLFPPLGLAAMGGSAFVLRRTYRKAQTMDLSKSRFTAGTSRR